MSKVRSIARYHFRQETGKRSFLLVLFSLPLFVTFTIGMGYLFASLEEGQARLGIVDRAGLLVSTALDAEEYDVEVAWFATEDAARAALDGDRIDAYYVIFADYLDTQRTRLVVSGPLQPAASDYFYDLVRLNLMADLPPAIAGRALAGPELTVRATSSGREFPGGNPTASQVLPVVAAAVFGFLILTTAGYMMEVIVEEKENRTMEIIVSSVSPGQMIAGKVIGALGIAFVQLVVWLAFLAGAIWVGANVLDSEWLRAVEIRWRDLLMIVVVAGPAYLFIGAFMTTIGVTLVERQEAQQIGPFFFIVLFLPLYLVIPLAQNPDGPLSLALSLFPLTSVTTIGFRSLFIEIPWWQIAAAAGISLGGGLAMIWLAGRAFRLSMLRYGRRLRWQELFAGRRPGPRLGDERRSP
jgi:ABC-2 type transport system permease protein